MSMPEYPPKLSAFIETISVINDETQRMEFLISYADRFKEVPPEIAKKPYPENNKVAFCESGAYVFLRMQKDDIPKFYFAVENPHGISAKALCSILDRTLSGEKAEEILKVPVDIVYQIFGQSLSMGKNLGLTGILLMMKNQLKDHLQETS